MFIKIFNLLSILSGLSLLIYSVYSWNDDSENNHITIQILMLSMFLFGGIENVINKQRKMKSMGLLYLAAAIVGALVLMYKY
ncbi:hypothetical protein [Peribacillus kribbensis]|uniref:hypothetical protein n=1 Tax=Peribacillus kribbensis TaxID=356658 RepID=UPI000420A14A|nr:hypothetical protein [Peribacillus kribbensis]